VKALDVLPYHVMGVTKYRELGIPYPLEGVEPTSKEKAAEAKRIILTAFWQVRRQKS
jgi:pyruvate formate lyase activating enzyme